MAMESCAVCEIPIRIAVSAGLMDTVIPDLWKERVSVHARVDPGMDMYAMESADPARDDEPDGRRNVEGPGPAERASPWPNSQPNWDTPPVRPPTRGRSTSART